MGTATLLLLVLTLLVAFSYAAGDEAAARRTRRWLTIGAATLAALAFIWHFRALLPPFVAPLILAYLLDPLLDQLERRGLTRVRAILVVYGTLLGLLLTAALVIVPPVIRQVGQVITPLTAEGGVDLERVQSLFESQETLREQLGLWLRRTPLPEPWVQRIEDNLAAYDFSDQLAKAAEKVVQQLQAAAQWVAGQVSGLIWVALLPITLFYFLRDFDPLRRRLYHLVPPDRRPAVAEIVGSINRALGSYLRGYVILSLMVGSLQTVILLALSRPFGFQYALLLGLTAALTYPIPFVGGFCSTILAALVVYFTGGHSLGEAVATWAVTQGINSVFDNVLQPRIIGGQVGLHPLVVMFAVLAGGMQFGLLGVICATPLAVMVKIILEHACPRLSEPLPDDRVAQPAEPPAPPRETTEQEEPENDDG